MKEAYYFSHDSNARYDEKMLQMRSVYRSEGYGWYWILIEMMRDANAFRLQYEGKYALKSIARELDTDEENVKKFIDDCIHEFLLFVLKDGFFYSESLLRRMADVEAKREKARKSANVRWERNANAMQTHSDGNAIKEKKGKEKKRNNTPKPPKGDGAVFSPDSPKTDERVEAGATKPLIKPLEFPSPEFEAIWREWTEHKQIEKRKAYKSVLAEQKGINHLVDLSGGKVAHARQIVDQSMAQNWQALFALKTPFVAVRANTGEPRKETLEEIKARIKFVP